MLHFVSVSVSCSIHSRLSICLFTWCGMRNGQSIVLHKITLCSPAFLCKTTSYRFPSSSSSSSPPSLLYIIYLAIPCDRALRFLCFANWPISNPLLLALLPLPLPLPFPFPSPSPSHFFSPLFVFFSADGRFLAFPSIPVQFVLESSCMFRFITLVRTYMSTTHVSSHFQTPRTYVSQTILEGWLWRILRRLARPARVPATLLLHHFVVLTSIHNINEHIFHVLATR